MINEIHPIQYLVQRTLNSLICVLHFSVSSTDFNFFFSSYRLLG